MKYNKTPKLKIGTILFVLIILLSCFVPLWLTIGLVVMLLFFLMVIKLLTSIQVKLIRDLSKWTFLVLFIFSICIIFKTLIFEAYRVSSSSMNDTLYSGDIIAVDKLSYGPILPRNPLDIPWINLLFYSNASARKEMNKNWWSHKRLPGVGRLSKGDILVYQQARGFFIVKRCIGLAGDSLHITGGEIYINRERFSSANTVIENYQLTISGDRKTFLRKLDSLKIKNLISSDSKRKMIFNGLLSLKEVNLLKQTTNLKSINKDLENYSSTKNIFVTSYFESWTLDDMGPFVIPKKGMKITLNPQNYSIYAGTIRDYEGILIKKKNNDFFDSEGKKIFSYTFSQDFCFLMGDNRTKSTDSRSFGFVPVSNIIGRVPCILFSHVSNEIKWKRFFKFF